MGNGSSIKYSPPPQPSPLPTTKGTKNSISIDGKFTSQYCLNSILDRQETYSCYTATCLRTQQQVMMKKIKLAEIIKNCDNIDEVINEFRIMKLLDHHFLIKLLHASHEKMFCYLVMPSLTGGDLRYHLRLGEIFSEQTIAYLISCIGSALQYLHSRHIIHRNVIPENIILDQYCRPVLVDMSLAFLGERDHIPICTSTSGALRYVAPETFSPSHRHSFHADFWSLGAVMYELYFHQPPFQDHCPPSYVYFVTNYYETMWDRIYESITIETEVETMTNSSLLRYNNQFTHNLTDPNAKLLLNSDGSLPASLLVKYDSDLLTEPRQPSLDLSGLLQGLLDPRLEKRLGTFNEKRSFSCHPFFQKYNYAQPELLNELPSPMLSESTACFTSGTQILKANSHQAEDDPIEGQLTPEMLEILKEYRFGFGMTIDEALTANKPTNIIAQMLMKTRTESTPPQPRESDLVDEVTPIPLAED